MNGEHAALLTDMLTSASAMYAANDEGERKVAKLKINLHM
jgi:hypothetical protein